MRASGCSHSLLPSSRPTCHHAHLQPDEVCSRRSLVLQSLWRGSHSHACRLLLGLWAAGAWCLRADLRCACLQTHKCQVFSAAGAETPCRVAPPWYGIAPEAGWRGSVAHQQASTHLSRLRRALQLRRALRLRLLTLPALLLCALCLGSLSGCSCLSRLSCSFALLCCFECLPASPVCCLLSAAPLSCLHIRQQLGRGPSYRPSRECYAALTSPAAAATCRLMAAALSLCACCRRCVACEWPAAACACLAASCPARAACKAGSETRACQRPAELYKRVPVCSAGQRWPLPCGAPHLRRSPAGPAGRQPPAAARLPAQHDAHALCCAVVAEHQRGARRSAAGSPARLLAS